MQTVYKKLITGVLLALSTNAGTSWTFPTSITQPQTNPTYAGSGLFQSASCYQTTCIAVGSYNDAVHNQIPLLALSTDTGATWTYPSSITNVNNISPAYGLAALFNAASCYENTCIAVGSYYDTNFVLRPLMAVSTDAGASWTYPTSITNPTTTPTFQGNGNLYGASCIGSTCIATGYYTSIDSVERPLLALSTDSGGTWTFPNDITEPAVPSFYFGLFFSGGGGF